MRTGGRYRYWMPPVSAGSGTRSRGPHGGADATDSTVLACDGRDIVGMAHYLDLRLTVPGGAVLPVAGVTIVAVSPPTAAAASCARYTPSCTTALPTRDIRSRA